LRSSFTLRAWADVPHPHSVDCGLQELITCAAPRSPLSRLGSPRWFSVIGTVLPISADWETDKRSGAGRGDPGVWSEFRKASDREIGKTRENRGEIVAQGDSQPSAAFHNRENRRNLRSRLWAADVQAILSTKSYRSHRVLRQVVAQFKLWILQESGKRPPKRESVLAGFAERTGGQCDRLCRLDLAANIIEKRLGGFLTPDMAPRGSQRFAASFRIDGKQFVRLSHNRGCNRISGI
jgi:hypothetical protein